jgi:hypothetical protein
MALKNWDAQITSRANVRPQDALPKSPISYSDRGSSPVVSYSTAVANSGSKSSGSSSGGGGNSGGGGGGSASTSSYSGGSSGGGGGGFDYSSYLAQLQAAANAAYSRAKAALDSSRDTTLEGLLSSYNARKDALQGQYDSSKQTLDDDNASALRAAYINKMINARDLNQLLTAQGLTGGASETTTANMLNNYANNRNALNKTYNTNLRELLTSHKTSLADALASYNEQKAQAMQNYANYLAQLEQNRMNMVASVMPSFSNLLSMV